MMVWLLLIICAAGASWQIATKRLSNSSKSRTINLPRDYLVGLNFLLNDETDKAVDVFIKMLEVDSDTIETHLAVAKLFRKRGEVDRAIRIHQNLIARPQLDKHDREQALFELGQDYLSAGVLDRAERVFLELIKENSHSAQATFTLIDIYQQVKHWDKAIDTAKKYQSITREPTNARVAQYYCEIAESKLAEHDYKQAEDYLDDALRIDKNCVRASLLLAKLFIAQEQYKQALKHLKRIQEQNPDYLSVAIDLVALCYEKLNLEEELVVYLKKLVDEHPRVPVVMILAERIRKWKGDKAAVNFVADYVRSYPSLNGLYLFVNIYISCADGRAKQDLYILQNLMKNILSRKPDYQCSSCGFSGNTLHWQCPGCKQWSTILPVETLEEDIQAA